MLSTSTPAPATASPKLGGARGTRPPQGRKDDRRPFACGIRSDLEAKMTGDELIKQFEDGTTPPGSFHHADHVRLAFEYLCRYSVLEALERFSDALKRFATARGKAQLYHETITWTYLLLIHELMARAGRA